MSRSEVDLASMPQGVEHGKLTPIKLHVFKVDLASMPQGVEHTVKAVKATAVKATLTSPRCRKALSTSINTERRGFSHG